MTPRDDLNGRIPRELLHGALSWSGLVTWGQQIRFEDGGPMIAAPCDWPGFDTAPMGSQEMYLYFDFCREIIDASWIFLEKHQGLLIKTNAGVQHDDRHALKIDESIINDFMSFLKNVKDKWLNSPFEGGSTPQFIIDCDRRRVPRGRGVAIEGIEGMQPEQHLRDCDCPICQLMSEGAFRSGFTSIDGHHLEIDDEFAFSTHESRESWEEQQREFAQWSANWEQQKADLMDDENTEEDPFASPWMGIVDDQPIPGDRDNILTLTFMVAEIVTELTFAKAPIEDIQLLNSSFAAYRRSGVEDRSDNAAQLKSHLQSLSERYPSLVSRSADLQSRIDESLRGISFNCNDDDIPF